MNHENFIEAAWEISNLMNKLNDLIRDQCEDAFIDRYIKKQEQKLTPAQRAAELRELIRC